MALAKQVIPLQFAEGVETKEDPKVLPPLKLLTLENGQRRQRSKIEKRYGCRAFGQGVIEDLSVTLGDSDALGVFDDELLQFTKQSLYTYSECGDNWTMKGPCISVKAEIQDVIKNSYEQTQVDMAVVGNIALIAYEDTRTNTFYVTCVDLETGARTLVDSPISTAASRPRCVAFNGNLYFLYVETATNDLKGYKVNPRNPYPLSGVVTISSSVSGANPHYDVIVTDTYIVVAYNVQGAAQTRLHKLNENLAVQMTVNLAFQSTNAVALLQGAMSKIFLVVANATDVKCAIYDVNIVLVMAIFTVESVANVKRITGYLRPDDSGVQLYYEISAGSTYNTLIRQCFVSQAGAAGTPAVFLRSVGIASKAWAYSPDTTNRGFLCVVHESVLQSTFFVARNDGFIVAKVAEGFAGGLLTRSLPAAVTERETGKFIFAVLTKNPVVDFSTPTWKTFRGVSFIELDYTDLSNFTGVQLGPNYHIIGGVLSTYDGQAVVEHGFNLFPENVSAAQSTAAGALTLTGVYNYKVVYAWTDSAGQIHRSAPSDNVQITLTGANNTVTLTIPTLRLTQKSAASAAGRTDINIEVYRTENAGTVWYRVSSLTAPLYNTIAADTVSFVDLLADTAITSNNTIYTTGGVLENIGAPSASIVTVWQNRVVLAGTPQDDIVISKEREQGGPVEFADELRLTLDNIGGRTVAAIGMDDKLVLFKEDSIYYTYGAGPDSTGAGGSFPPPTQIPSDVGCIDPNSVALVPEGVLFKSRTGRYLLSRELQVSYIGSPVEYWNNLTDTSAVLFADSKEVRFTTLEGPTLVYNYFFKQWAVFTFAATDAIIWKKQFVYIRRLTGSASKVVKEVAGFFLDVDQTYSLKIGIAWLALAGVQAIQRVYRAIFLGEYKSAHKLRISIGYNYSQTYAEDHIWDPAAELEIGTYGDSETYGSDPMYGGNDSVYQPRVHLGQQKNEAVRFLIEDITQDESSFESFNLTSLALQVGVKKGLWKTKPGASL